MSCGVPICPSSEAHANKKKDTKEERLPSLWHHNHVGPVEVRFSCSNSGDMEGSYKQTKKEIKEDRLPSQRHHDSELCRAN